MQLAWTGKAKSDIDSWLDYMQIRNPEAGVRIAEDVFEAAAKLIDNPLKGRVGAVHGTRELIISDNPLKIIYTADGELVTVLAVLHQRQRWHVEEEGNF